MGDESDDRWSWAIAIGALGYQTFEGLVTALMGRFPATLDELQHLSYIRSMESSPQIFTRFDDLRVLDASGTRFTQTGNYLDHPSPYYLLMAPVDRMLNGSILGLRLVNLGLSLCAVALMLTAGFSVLKGWKERAVFAAALVLFPKLAVIGGLINNDNGALIATGLGFLALIAWQRAPGSKAALLLAVALALCGWTKLTVLLMIAFATLIGEALRLWAGAKRPGLGALAIVGAGFGVAALPSLANIAAYGRVLHHWTAFYVPPAQRISLSVAGYTAIFLRDMVDKWPAVEPGTTLAQLSLYLVLGLATAAVAVGLRRVRAADSGIEIDAAWRTGCAMILAVAPILLLHLQFGWHTFVEDGYVGIAQTRYYYGLWPGVALGLTLLWRSYPGRRLTITATILTIVTLVSSSVGFQRLLLLAHGQTTIT